MQHGWRTSFESYADGRFYSDQFKSRCRREKSAICSLLLFLEMSRKRPRGQLAIEAAFAAAKRPSIEERRLSSTSPDPIVVSDQSETLSAEPSNISPRSSTCNAHTPSRGAGPYSIDRATASADGGFNFTDIGSLYDEEHECWTTDPRTLPPGLKEKFLRDPFSPTSEFSVPARSMHGGKRSFQLRWLAVYPWLVYSSLCPTIARLLQLLATWPVTTCSCERSISALRCLKTYLRSTMHQEWLSSLAILHVHGYNVGPIDKDEVIIRRFSQGGTRRIIL